MIKSTANLNWVDIPEMAPAVIAILGMPLTYFIADGIRLALIVYTVIKIFSGRIKECPPSVGVIAIIFISKFAFL